MMVRNGFSPLRDLMTMRESMDRLLDDRWVSPGSWLTWSSMGTSYLPLDVYETSDDVVVRAAVAGVGPDGIDIQVQGGILTLRAKSEEPALPDGATWLLHEVSAGEYIRQVTLPRAIDAEQGRSAFENGVLTITLPKTADAKPKRINVASTAAIDATE